jgi:glyoxylase-like metal-dependent hydrolase (beta-lactamase superfamily II)
MNSLKYALIALAILPAIAVAQVNTRLDQVKAAPVPASVHGPKIDQAKGYFVEEIKKGSGAYWVTEGTHQVMFLTTGKGVVVVDAPPLFGDKIVKAIAEVTKEPVKHLIYSHGHADHITGAHHFPAGIEIIASAHIASEIKTSQRDKRIVPFGTFVGGKPAPLVTKIVKPNQKLKIGTQEIVFRELPAHHSHSDLAVFLPKHGILMAVDLVWPGWVPFERLGTTNDVAAYIAAHDSILKMKWDVMVAGHVARLATRVDVETNREYVNDLLVAGAKSLQTIDYMAAAKKTGFENPFLTVETYLDMVSKSASDEVEKKWGGKLAGSDIWTYANARAVIMYLRLY